MYRSSIELSTKMSKGLDVQMEWEMRLQSAHADFLNTLRSIEPVLAEREPNEGKWSATGHAQHLVMSLRPVWFTTFLPVWLHALIFGRSNREARNYGQVTETYLRKLEGRKPEAPPMFRPTQRSKISVSKANTLLKSMLGRYIKSLRRYSDSDLDSLLLPHPLMGKCTLREMAYFLAWHASYHEQLLRRDYEITAQFDPA